MGVMPSHQGRQGPWPFAVETLQDHLTVRLKRRKMCSGVLDDNYSMGAGYLCVAKHKGSLSSGIIQIERDLRSSLVKPPPQTGSVPAQTRSLWALWGPVLKMFKAWIPVNESCFLRFCSVGKCSVLETFHWPCSSLTLCFLSWGNIKVVVEDAFKCRIEACMSWARMSFSHSCMGWKPQSCWPSCWHLPQCTGLRCGGSDPSWGRKKKKKMEGNRKAIFDQWFQKKQNVKGQILIHVALFIDIGGTSDKGMRVEFKQKCDSCISEKRLWKKWPNSHLLKF